MIFLPQPLHASRKPVLRPIIFILFILILLLLLFDVVSSAVKCAASGLKSRFVFWLIVGKHVRTEWQCNPKTRKNLRCRRCVCKNSFATTAVTHVLFKLTRFTSKHVFVHVVVFC
ncbi:hypothetical protein TRVL_09816 [Trypanosoma vivax]|nr:hypothetical protein TRVL_09816 [Trypanosoma vivax]